MSTVPKSLRAPEGHEQFLTVLADLLDAGAVVPCTGPGWQDWTAEHDQDATTAAVNACQGCPALAACRAYATAADEPAGVWGSTTPNQRARATRATEQGAAA